MYRAIAILCLLVATSVAVFSQLGLSVFSPGADHPAVQYFETTSDPIVDLNRRLMDGTDTLESNGTLGYLESVLDALDVPVESQVVVYSKNSLQSLYISPENPRLIYFNDEVVVAAIQGAPLIEVTAIDPEKGVIFYSVEQEALSPLQFLRQNATCLRCHESLNSLGVPGMLVRSVMPSEEGWPNPQLGNFVINHESSFEERWGGWYVTGSHEGIRHLGNGFITDRLDEESIRGNQELVLDSMEDRVDSGAYLVPSSDISALMVFDHQMHMTNLLIRYGWEVRYALAFPEGVFQLNDRALEDAVNEVVDYMLFVNEPQMSPRLSPGPRFREAFEQKGPRDGLGRSLRQLDLDQRLMRYPLSYMIYSTAFDGLPFEAKNAIYARLWQVLSGTDADSRYDRLSPEDRRSIVEILRETKDGLPDYF